jgi:hypothetical protein
MKQIEPVQIWVNGSQQTGSWINAYIIKDNLQDTAIFYWAIWSDGEEPYTQGIKLSEGNCTMVDPEYDLWGQSTDINQAAYEWICDQLSLTLIP